ncbi:bifunctional phosphopantothenoylcysteine decarboxylase/phosphopantothenate--cysteine ligase CoaBC [Syntrophomonas erecta subsp. sporosyntropha]
MAKTIGIGVTGGIAAYKIVDLVSRLKKDGLDVVVIMTEGAAKFVTPLTFKTISGREVLTDLWQESQEFKVQHIGVAEQLDLLVIAPATANFIAKMAYGIADDLLSTIVLANTVSVLVVPAMNSNMYRNTAVQRNLTILNEYGYRVMKPESGMLACGVTGPGRLPELDDIYDEIQQMLYPKKDLAGKRLMVNAGTTCEDIDPVRFIANRSSGKMGFCIAEEASARGAEVVLVNGRCQLEPPAGVNVVPVWSADEMCEVMRKYQPACDVIIGSAAVGDFKVATVETHKRKKPDDKSEKWVLELVGNPDILQELGKHKTGRQVIVGFAAETENIVENARKKIETKNLDFIVANDVTQEGAGFETDTNIVTLITRDGEVKPLPKMSKREVAAAIIDKVVEIL